MIQNFLVSKHLFIWIVFFAEFFGVYLHLFYAEVAMGRDYYLMLSAIVANR